MLPKKKSVPRSSRQSGLAKTMLEGTMKRRRRQGRQRKRWDDKIREWTGLEFGKSHWAVELWCPNDPRG